MGRCGHTDHYVFVHHDEGLGIFAPETGNSCPVSPSCTLSFSLYVFLRCFFMIRTSLSLHYTVALHTAEQRLGMLLLLLLRFFHIDIQKLMGPFKLAVFLILSIVSPSV